MPDGRKMKITLVAVNSKYIHTSPAADSLAAALSDAGIMAEVLSFTVNQPPEELLGRIFEAGGEAVCFSTYIWNVEHVLRLCRDLKKVRPDAELWLGGPEVSFRAEKLLEKEESLRGIMRGEGEETVAELFSEGYREGTPSFQDLAGISGITFRDENGKVSVNTDRLPLDMNTLSFPYRKSLADPNRIYYYESSRGCPYRCSYCLSSVDRVLRFKDLPKVFSELGWFLDNGVKQVKFVDRTFNVSRERSLAVWKYLKENDNGITNFHFEICGELLSEEELAYLKTLRPGQVQFEIGVQTTNPKTLKAICRMRDEEKLKANVSSLLSGRNIHIHLDLIAGLPFEDFESFKHSFNEVYAMHPINLQLGFLKVLKGTPMEAFAATHAFQVSPAPPYEILSNAWIGYPELLKLQKTEEMVEVYHNSCQFEKTLPVLLEGYRKEGKTPFDFFYDLALFYREKGYDRMEHGRMRRYEILLEFAEQSGREREELVPFLLYDYVSRERLKHWPSWAGNAKKPEGFDYEHTDPLTGNALHA